MTRETEVLRTMATDQRRGLADVLNGLSEEQWDAPSLCEGWRVKEVAAHILMPFRVSIPALLWSLIKARGKFDAVADRLARRDAAALSTEELVAILSANVEHPWKPPGGGPAGALSHDVIHGLDITEALGLDPVSPPDRIGAVLESFTPRQLGFFGVDLTDRLLVATDVDWSYGQGREVAAPAKDVLLMVTGRIPAPAA